MPSYTAADIRNLALVGSAGSGKTSLTEALLLEAGAIHHLGLVEKGETVSDFTDEEKKHGNSLFASVVHMDYEGKHINVIDTPGATDFIGQAIAVMPAVETVAVVVNAATGVDALTRKMMEIAAEGELPRMIIVNRIDAENIDLPSLVESIREVLGSECLPVNLPTGGASGVVDCFFNAEGDSDLGSVSEAHTRIIEQVIEVDEELAMTYLDGEEVTPEQLHNVFEKSLREGHLVPIAFTAARRHDNPESSVGIAE
ncbi:MAG: GTP-binding protein, partial [Rhodospirillales bacterium]|nr:GTP-binding protein [Rhodospirillales bacterium]